MTGKKKIIAIVTVAAAIATVFSLQIFKRTLFRITSEFYHPFFTPVSNAENYSLRQALLLKTKTELADELLKMQKMNEEKKAELQFLQSIKEDKIKLEQQLKIKPAPGYKCVFAEIYKRDPAFWYERFSVNKGLAAGIKPGSIVLCRIPESAERKHTFAVIGRVSEMAVSEHESTIRTIISRNCKLSVILKDSAAAGILEGGTIKNGKSALKVAYLPTFKTYRIGEEVFTSGLCTDADTERNNNIRHSTPAGLFIGKIAGKVQIVNKLNAEAEITPAVDFDYLRYVIILVRDDKVVKTNQ